MDEAKEYEGLKSPKRRREWLAARAGLKWLLRAAGEPADPREYKVSKDRFNRPWVSGFPDPLRRLWACGIAHSGERAAVVVSSLAGLKLGIDIQVPSLKLVRRKAAFVSPWDGLEDQGDDELLRVTRLWACKEAASKAMGLGLAVDFKKLRVEARADGVLRVDYGSHALFEGWHGRCSDLAWAVGYGIRGRFWRKGDGAVRNLDCVSEGFHPWLKDEDFDGTERKPWRRRQTVT
ncbi:4'-phosphopantetheinyl transferase family protein [Desulfosoma sp.]